MTRKQILIYLLILVLVGILAFWVGVYMRQSGVMNLYLTPMPFGK